VQVTCTINFCGLITIPNYGSMMLRIGVYLKLPQTTIAMVNGNNVTYNLTTWHGMADLSALTSEEVRAQFLEPCLQDGPIALRSVNFNLGDANINTMAIMESIHAKILKLGFRQICKSIFAQLCPSYSNQPHAALEHIRQMLTGPDGQSVTATVIKYYQCMLNAARPFATQKHYAISVCNCFIQGLDWTLLPPFCSKYANHSIVHDLDGAYQRHMLLVILSVAQKAKDNQNQIQDIAHGMLASQGFIMSPVGDAGAYASQDAKMMTYYKDGEHHEHSKLSCWGCGGNHSWMKRGKVVCSRDTDPQAIKVAGQRYAEFKDAQAKRGNKPKGKGKRTIHYKDMDEKSKKKMHKTILAMTVEESMKATMVVTAACTGLGPTVFMLSTLSIPVFIINTPQCRILPVPIQAALPHITLQLGSAL
jgi:hypothetical protein